VENKWQELIELLDEKNVIFTDGLTDAEVLQIEFRHGFRFPDDLRDFLQTAMPKGYSFTNWRSDQEPFPELLSYPLHGILSDVEHGFWLPEWGTRPALIEEARAIVEEQVKQAPKLIPVYAYLMMPDRPSTLGNPVLSVHQTDIIYYGFDLEDYLRHEFDLPGRKPWPAEIKRIEFWDADRWQETRWGEWQEPPWQVR
jgi:hypothetical protein